MNVIKCGRIIDLDAGKTCGQPATRVFVVVGADGEETIYRCEECAERFRQRPVARVLRDEPIGVLEVEGIEHAS